MSIKDNPHRYNQGAFCVSDAPQHSTITLHSPFSSYGVSNAYLEQIQMQKPHLIGLRIHSIPQPLNDHQYHVLAATAVKLFFDQIFKGHTKTEIASELNARGYRTQRGKKFTQNSFDGWHSNKKYIGIYTWDVRSAKGYDGRRNNHLDKPSEEQIVIPGAIPAIIDSELFEKVNELMATRRFKPSYRKAKAVYLLSDKVYCGKCGARYNGNGYTNKGAQYRYYSCSRKCGNRSIRKYELERMVIQQIVDSYFTEDSMKEVVNRIQDMYVEHRKSAHDDSEPLKRELAELKMKIDNWIDVLGAGLSNKDMIIEKINEASARKEIVEDALRKIEIINANSHLDESKITVILEGKKQQLMSADDESKKAVIQEFVDSVTVVYDDGTDEFGLTLVVRVINGGGEATPLKNLSITAEIRYRK